MSRKAAPAGPDARLFDADALEQAMGALALAGPELAPPKGLWGRIAEAMGPEGLVAERQGEGRWRRLAPGVEIKPLWGKRTFLIRCEPGAVVPAHRHRTFEHTMILEGDIQTTYGEFRAGDYQGMPQGPHADWSTRGGCLVLVQYDA